MQSTAMVQPDRFKALCDNLQRLAHENNLDEILSIYVVEMLKNEFEALHNVIHKIALEKKWKGLESLALHNIEADKQFLALLASPPPPSPRDEKHVATPPAATTAAVAVPAIVLSAPSVADTLLNLIKEFRQEPYKPNVDKHFSVQLSLKLKKDSSLGILCDIFLQIIRGDIYPDNQFFGECIYHLYEKKLAQHAKEIYLHLEETKRLSSYACQWAIACARDTNHSIDIDFAFAIFQNSVNLGIETDKIYNEMINVAAINKHLGYAKSVYDLTLKLKLADHFSHGYAVKAGVNANDIEFALYAYTQAIESRAVSDKFFNCAISFCSRNIKDTRWKNLAYQAYFDMVKTQLLSKEVLQAMEKVVTMARSDDRQDILQDIEKRKASRTTYFFSPPAYAARSYSNAASLDGTTKKAQPF